MEWLFDQNPWKCKYPLFQIKRRVEKVRQSMDRAFNEIMNGELLEDINRAFCAFNQASYGKIEDWLLEQKAEQMKAKVIAYIDGQVACFKNLH